ncbi:hypothetical protein ACFL5Q_06285 [Planctomycetota bacterium]
MEKEPKKTWSKPQLIVLVRGKPEESVLLGCKALSDSGPGGFKCSGCSDPASS